MTSNAGEGGTGGPHGGAGGTFVRTSLELEPVIPRLRRYARLLMGDAQRADDLVQETLARGWEKRALWREGSDLRAWLFTIMHNLFVSQLQSEKRQARTISLEDASAELAERALARGVNPIERIELIELAGQLLTLPPEQREILLLVAVEQLRYEEAAEVLQIPIGTVMSRLSRARERLRKVRSEPSALKRVK